MEVVAWFMGRDGNLLYIEMKIEEERRKKLSDHSRKIFLQKVRSWYIFLTLLMILVPLGVACTLMIAVTMYTSFSVSGVIIMGIVVFCVLYVATRVRVELYGAEIFSDPKYKERYSKAPHYCALALESQWITASHPKRTDLFEPVPSQRASENS